MPSPYPLTLNFPEQSSIRIIESNSQRNTAMENRVMKIVPADVSDFAKEVDSTLMLSSSGENVNLGQFGGSTIAAGQGMARKRMQPVSIQSCNVIFRAGGIEYDEWAAALLLMARSAEFLRRKARDGQCYNHEQPCMTAREEEVGVYRDCLDSFQTLLNELKSKDINDPD